VETIALSPNGKTVADGNYDGTVRLWDVEKGKVVANWTGHTRIVYSLCWRADGQCVVSGSSDGTVRVWDVKSGKTVLDPIMTGHQEVYVVKYSPDTTKIATGGREEDGVKIWDAKTGKLLLTIEHRYGVWSLAWTSDQKKLISGSYDASIRLFDTATWKQIAVLDGHKHVVRALSLFGSDRLLASASRDKTVRLWNLDTNLQVGPTLRHEEQVNGIAISADAKLLVTPCFDHNVYLWDIYTILQDTGLEDLMPIPDVSINASANNSPPHLQCPLSLAAKCI
jgi:WD40 repeat protein